jgi:hypothetical protein
MTIGFIEYQKKNKPNVVIHAYNTSTWETEVGSKFHTSLGYMARLYLKIQKQNRKPGNPELRESFQFKQILS